MRLLGRLVLLTLAFALITVAIGWWSVAVVGTLWGWIGRSASRHPATEAGVAAGVAWGILLSYAFVVGEGGILLEQLSSVMAIPAWLVVLATLAIAVVLAFLGGWLGSAGATRDRLGGDQPSV